MVSATALLVAGLGLAAASSLIWALLERKRCRRLKADCQSLEGEIETLVEVEVTRRALIKTTVTEALGNVLRVLSETEFGVEKGPEPEGDDFTFSSFVIVRYPPDGRRQRIAEVHIDWYPVETVYVVGTEIQERLPGLSDIVAIVMDKARAAMLTTIL